MWGALIAAGASLLSSYLNKKKGQSQSTTYNPSAAGEAERRLFPANTYGLGNYYYPGLLPPPPTRQDANGIWNYTGTDPYAPKAPKTPATVPSGSRSTPHAAGHRGGLLGRAKGGPVKPGKPYLVGEKGPEKLAGGGTSERSKDRLGNLSSAMLDSNFEPRQVPGDFPSNRLVAYPTSQPGIRPAAGGFTAGLGQPVTEAPNEVADILARILASLPHRAGGGPLDKGKATVVGEKGPEVIVPNKAGTVIPHEQSGLPDTGAAAPGAAMGAEMGGPAADALAGGGMPLPGFGDTGDSPPGGEGDESLDPLIKFVLEAVLEKIAKMSGAGGAAGMGSPLGSMAGDGGTTPPSPGGGLLGGGAPPMEGRATGGPLIQGRPYLVGERGPELQVNAGAQSQPPVSRAPSPIASHPTPVTGRGATVTQDTNPSYGSQVVSQNQGLIANPGQLSSTTYERGQAAANKGEMMTQNAISGFAGKGIDLASTGVGALRESAALSGAHQRSDAARDYGLASETLRRTDIAAASDAYRQMLDQIFGMQKAQAAAIGGQPANQTTTVSGNPYGAFATGLGLLSQYLSQSPSNSGNTNQTTGGQPVNIGGTANM